jgi:RIO-like serine/threonine protein kinase
MMGKTVEYSYSMSDIKNALLKVHRWIISEFKDIHHVQKVAIISLQLASLYMNILAIQDEFMSLSNIP